MSPRTFFKTTPDSKPTNRRSRYNCQFFEILACNNLNGIGGASNMQLSEIKSAKFVEPKRSTKTNAIFFCNTSPFCFFNRRGSKTQKTAKIGQKQSPRKNSTHSRFYCRIQEFMSWAKQYVCVSVLLKFVLGKSYGISKAGP